jgi:hypothetical protein
MSYRNPRFRILFIVTSLLANVKSFEINEDSDSQYPIAVKAKYFSRQGNINWSFPLFYGFIDQNLDQFYVKIDFYYDKVIFISEDLNTRGIDCSADFECSYSPRESYIIENTSHKLITTHQAGVPVYFNPFFDSLSPYACPKLQVFLNNSDKSFIDFNILGISPQSVIWPYLSLLYRSEKVFVQFETEFPLSNSHHILENIMFINTTMTFFPKIEAITYSKSTGVTSLITNDTEMSFMRSSFIVNSIFSYESPYLFVACECIFEKILLELNKIICINPSRCQKYTDLFTNINFSLKLTFSFSDKSNQNSIKNLVVDFSLDQLYEIDRNGFIIYNFESTRCTEESESFIILGLLFLRKVFLVIEYQDATKTIDLLIIRREMHIPVTYFKYFVVFTFVFSLLLTIFMIQINNSSLKMNSISDSNNSLYA